MALSISDVLKDIDDLQAPNELQEHYSRFLAWLSLFGDVKSLEAQLKEAGHLRTAVTSLLISVWRCLNDSSQPLEELSEELDDALEDLNDATPYLMRPAQYDRVRDRSWHAEIERYPPYFDSLHVSDKFPGAKPHVAVRIGNANAARRAKLAWIRRRKQEEDLLATISLSNTKTADKGTTFHDSGLGTSRTAPTTAVCGVRDSAPVKAATPNLHEQEEEVIDLDRGSVVTGTSYTTDKTGAERARTRVHVPAPPAAFYEHGVFECPYCTCMLRVQSVASWRRHVFRDLQPYTCTHEPCLRGDEPFSKRREWVNHERSCHRVRWRCPMDECCQVSLAFSSYELLRSHIGARHPGKFSDSQLDLIMKSSKRHHFDSSDCPFCGHTFRNEKSYDNHVADELEQLALFVLPRSIDGDEVSASIDGSSVAEKESIKAQLKRAIDNFALPTDLGPDTIPTQSPMSPAELPASASRRTPPSSLHRTPSYLQSTQPISGPKEWECSCGAFMEEIWWSCQACGKLKPSGHTGQDESIEEDDTKPQKSTCPFPGCGKIFRDLKIHMLTHQNERPEKCPILTCEYSKKGFSRKHDKDRHTLTHFKGTIVCGFCPGSDTSARKSFHRADVMRRHLTTVHGVEQNPPNSRKKPSEAAQRRSTQKHGSLTGKCSICSRVFPNAQQFYEHFDGCVLDALLKTDPQEAIDEHNRTSIFGDHDLRESFLESRSSGASPGKPLNISVTTEKPVTGEEEAVSVSSGRFTAEI